jgi:hypothetical protein
MDSRQKAESVKKDLIDIDCIKTTSQNVYKSTWRGLIDDF